MTPQVQTYPMHVLLSDFERRTGIIPTYTLRRLEALGLLAPVKEGKP
jgi:hypothetical protein